MRFEDRIDAGRRLAALVGDLADRACVVCGLPRGGVVVAAEVARAIGAPLDVLVARKLRTPGRPELAMGAVCEGDRADALIDEDLIGLLGIARDRVDREAETRFAEANRMARVYRDGRAPEPIVGRTAVVVDDGVATGWTIRAAMRALRAREPERIVLAIPVGPVETLRLLEEEADRVEFVGSARAFLGVGGFYDDFHQLEDDEVIRALHADGG
ncbi:MAG: phosphoribosyltransferase [Phycisphaeraceae bacterium]|nr:MAG: phosphoribosyltransferase [Phycisphaeraceae bacterium]